MTEAEAQTRIESMVDASTDPALSAAEITSLIDVARRSDAAGNPVSNVVAAATWAASTAYQIGDVVTADPAANRWWRCVTPGTSDATQPDWPDLGGVAPFSYAIGDDEVTWLDIGTAWRPTFNLDAGAAEGWRLKAGKAAGRYDFGTDGQTFSRGQLIAHCRLMESSYRRRLAQGV